MPSPTATSSEQVLDNGLKVQLLHEPRLKKAAAFLRVDAGSHDVDPAYPGLAHFLEHLFFLGTERHAGEQALMAYVQRQGGQLNASTRERHTDFFFEVPPAALSGALERLCEMLARPRLSAADQRREREVLHAEFIAWSRDAEAQHQLWLAAPLAARHPLRAFHAGNRYSLPLGNSDFQQALLAFHQRYFVAEQMQLCIAGPQSTENLRAVAERCARILPTGRRASRPVPPGLRDGSGDSPERRDPQRLNLVFACEDLPAGITSAVDFLTTWCTNPQPGGLFAELQRRELVESLKVRVLYQYAGQVVLDFDFKLADSDPHTAASVGQLCLAWLEFFEALGDWGPLREEYALLRKRRQLVSGALDQVRQHTDGLSLDSGLSEQGSAALGALLAQLKAEQLLHPLPAPSAPVAAVHWRLPQRNRFLRPNRRPEQPVADVRGMHYVAAAASAPVEGELFVRWRSNATRHPGMSRVLDYSLRRLVEEARQASVRLAFNRLGDEWLLRLSGVAEPIPALVEQVAEFFNSPPTEAWRHHNPVPSAAQTPIRELLGRLPEHCLGIYHSTQHDAREEVKPATLQKIWGSARWEGLALGFDGSARSALNNALRRLPGQPGLASALPPAPWRGQRWSQLGSSSGEHALLLFCPAPTGTLADEAAWRLLGHLAQTAFYQRMRVELQLGYAVFASFRQISGRPGLVFGVQSPGNEPGAILAHIEQFLEQLPRWVTNLGSSAVMSQAQSLAARWSREELDASQLAETLWQARLGGSTDDYLGQLQRAFNALRPADAIAAAQRLRDAEAGWLALSTGAMPRGEWQQVA